MRTVSYSIGKVLTSVMSTIAENIANVRERIKRAAEVAGRDPAAITLLAVSKTRPAGDLPLQWHFIGPIQSNKTRAIAEHFDWVHSVDRLKIAQRLSDQRPEALPALNICLQVNISGEDSKSGVTLAELPELAEAVAALPRLRLRGLMAIPAPADSSEQRRVPLAALREAATQLSLPLDTLSMGMSDDQTEAVQEGATIVRIGTALFGQRQYPQP